jgi:two-component system, LuxR family, sensor kinase FixL
MAKIRLRQGCAVLTGAHVKKTWQAGQESKAERRFQLVVEAAPNAMVMVGRTRKIVMVNAQAERSFQYSREELLGETAEILVPQRFRAHRPAMFEAFHATAQARQMSTGRDLYGLKKDGTEFPVEIGLNPIETEEGTMVLAAIVDITERKAAEAALKESQSRLQELHAELLHVSRLSAMGQMAAMVAHELSQPLTVISAHVEMAGILLDRGGDLPIERLRSAVARAGEQAVRAGQIIHRLCGFVSRRDSERRVEKISPLIKEAVELALIGAKQKGIEIEVEDRSNGAAVLADTIQIQQVLLNLLRNAAEAVAGLERRSIALLAEAAGETVRISVIDNGPGLPEEVRARLFKPFITTKETGMGIGLSICHTIVTAHNGRLWTEPNPEGGAIFRLAVPVLSAEEDAR